ncbi:MAG: hypothetical protein J6V53_04190 [Alphaproteobacteria bacterium]|nr:hypothetical protein [Alphaproteobacteria bacterium]
MIDKIIEFKNTPTHFSSTEEKFNYLKHIEEYVQKTSKTEEEKIINRRAIVRSNPSLFKALYADYQLPEERKKELLRVIDESVQSIALNSELRNQILNFTSLDFEDKKNLLQNLAVYMMRDSGVSPFQTGIPNVELNIEELNDTLSGYATKQTKYDFTNDAIYVNKKKVEKASNIHELLDTFFHEALHTRQTRNTDNFTGLSRLYYVSTESNMQKWERPDILRSYFGQPIEKEAWFFGTQVQNSFVKKLKEADPTPHFTRLARLLTGKEHSSDEVTFKKYRNSIEVTFAHPIDQNIQNEFFEDQDLPLKIDTRNYFTTSKRILIDASKENGIQNLDDLANIVNVLSGDLTRLNAQRKHFQNKLLKYFENAPLLEKEKNKLCFQGNQPSLIQYIQNLKTTMTARYDAKTNQTVVSLPLNIQSVPKGKKINYIFLPSPKESPTPSYMPTNKESIR